MMEQGHRGGGGGTGWSRHSVAERLARRVELSLDGAGHCERRRATVPMRVCRCRSSVRRQYTWSTSRWLVVGLFCCTVASVLSVSQRRLMRTSIARARPLTDDEHRTTTRAIERPWKWAGLAACRERMRVRTHDEAV
jgi:hypothetical protein